MSFPARLFFAWACFFRVLFDGAFAARANLVRDALPPAPAPVPEPVKEVKEAPKPEKRAPASIDAALQLLALLQREGRFVDFLEQDITTFPDADVGTAARVVHEGCRRALHGHGKVEPIHEAEEGKKVDVPSGFDAATLKLVGNVSGKGPYRGTLQHRGWRVVGLSLPEGLAGFDATIVAPAEVEL